MRILINLIGMTVPILITAALTGRQRAVITGIFRKLVLVILLMRVASSLAESSSRRSASSIEVPWHVEASSTEASIEVHSWASSEASAIVLVVGTSASTSSPIAWVSRAVLPKVCALVSSTWLIPFLILSLLFAVLYLLGLSLRFLLHLDLLVRFVFPLLHEILYLLLGGLFWIIAVESEFIAPGHRECVEKQGLSLHFSQLRMIAR